MLIKGFSVIERTKDSAGIVSLAHYLQLEASNKPQVRLSFDEYKKAYERSSEMKPAIQDIEILDSESLNLAPQNPLAGTNLNPVLELLMSKLDVQPTENLINNTDTELIIQSELAEFLELPWESIANGICVLREIMHPANKQGSVSSQYRCLVIMSHSHMPDKTNIGNDVNEEIIDILKKITENNKDSFRISEVHFLKHGTRTAVEEIGWNRFGYVHIALHGEEDGRLCLEDATSYDKIVHIGKNDFINLLKIDPKPYFLVVYLSFCFSGGGTGSTSLAFDLIKDGVSENVIAYSGGAGSPSAKKFSSYFYNFLTVGQSPRSAFQSALIKYKSENPDSDYVPMFYTRT